MTVESESEQNAPSTSGQYSAATVTSATAVAMWLPVRRWLERTAARIRITVVTICSETAGAGDRRPLIRFEQVRLVTDGA